MITKLLSVFGLVVIVSFNQPTFAQSDNCFDGYSFKTSSVKSANSITNDINLSWDISSVTNKQDLKIEIEVQPLNGCWNLLDGTDRSEKRIYKINSSQKDKGVVELKFNELDTKCLKWRVKLSNNSNDCLDFTAWKYASLLN